MPPSWIAVAVVVLGLAVLARGVRLVAAGRREMRAPGADAEERMIGSLRLAGGVRWVNYGLVLVVLGGIAAKIAT